MRRVIVAVLVTFLAGCGFNWNENTVNPTPVPTPSATPTPGPTPTPSPTTTSDVSSLVVLVFGYSCNVGVPEPSHGDGVITTGCNEAALTATPKAANGDDAKLHGNNITWSTNVVPLGGARVEPDPNNPLFNRLVKVGTPRVAAQVTLTASLVDPVGKLFTATKTVTIVP